ncbi:hypothetical protein GGI1_21729, partial [Acidithiobacillus sp. GGI-221]
VNLTFRPLGNTAPGLPTGLPYQYAVMAQGVPLAIANAAVNLCNGQSGNTTAANGGVCTMLQSGQDAQVFY